LLMRHARAGSTPEWSAGHQEFEPERDARDRIVQNRYDEVALVPDERGRERAVPVRYCPVRLYPSDDWIDMTRGEYRTWWRALRVLSRALEAPRGTSGLVRWRISALGAAEEPWNEIR